MKIVLFLPSLGRGGAEHAAVALAREWRGAHSVRIAVLWSAEPGLDSPVPVDVLGGAAPTPFAGKLTAAARWALALRTYLRHARPDCVVCFLELANLVAAVGARAAGMSDRVVLTVHSDFRRYRWLTRALMRGLYPGLRVAAPSARLLERLVAARIARPSLAHVLENPLVWPAPREGLPHGLPARFILGMGRLAPEKDFALLLGAYALAQTQAPLPDLVIAGEGPERGALLELADSLGIGPRVYLPGFITDVAALLERADLLALTSQREGWPLVMVQALAAGCPVLAVDCETGPREILEDGRCGELVMERTPQAIASAMTCLLGDGARLDTLRRLGPARAEAYRADRVAAEWLRALQS